MPSLTKRNQQYAQFRSTSLNSLPPDLRSYHLPLLNHSEYPTLLYDPKLGVFLSKDTQRNYQVSAEGFLSAYSSVSQRYNRRKAELIAWECIHKRKPKDGFVIFFKDLNRANLKANNLQEMPRELFLKIKESLRIIQGGIKAVPHRSDQFKHLLIYRENSRTITRMFHDMQELRKEKRRIILKHTKLLAENCILN